MNDRRSCNSKSTTKTIPNTIVAELMGEVLARGRPFRLMAKGSSMSPFIRDSDVITVAPITKKIHLGEVISFINPLTSRLMVHRVVRISRKGYLTQGDNSPRTDGLISRSDILGRVVSIEHRGKHMRFGLGNERIIIALLTRWGRLVPLITSCPTILRNIIKRFIF